MYLQAGAIYWTKSKTLVKYEMFTHLSKSFSSMQDSVSF